MAISLSLDKDRCRKNSTLPVVGAVGVASAFLGAQTASASPIFTPTNIPVDSSHPATLDLNNDGVGDFVVEVSGSTKLHYSNSTDPTTADTLQEVVYDNSGPPYTFFSAAVLPPGSVVGPSSSFESVDPAGSTGLGGLYVAIDDGTPGTPETIGVEFQPAGATLPYYGYIVYEPTGTDLDGNDTGTVLGYGYESIAGNSITVPEPATLSLLALGVSGLLAHRKTRRG